jgi:uncharacterized protein (DUF58 family)
MPAMIEEIHYRVPWRARALYPGRHRSNQLGGGIEFRGNLPLLRSPDPRRLDIRASLSNPHGEWVVRSFRQRSQILIYLVADLSASIGFVGANAKLDVMADLTESLSFSAHRGGDRFGFLGCDETVREDFFLPATHAAGAASALAARVRALRPAGRSLHGLIDAPRYLSKQRSLVFLVSDFHAPSDFLRTALLGFSKHSMVPVVLWDQAELLSRPGFGIASLRDSETGRRRSLFLRPALREKIRAAYDARREKLNTLFFDLGLRPLFVEQSFSAESVSEYFYPSSATAQATG